MDTVGSLFDYMPTACGRTACTTALSLIDAHTLSSMYCPPSLHMHILITTSRHYQTQTPNPTYSEVIYVFGCVRQKIRLMYEASVCLRNFVTSPWPTPELRFHPKEPVAAIKAMRDLAVSIYACSNEEHRTIFVWSMCVQQNPDVILQHMIFFISPLHGP